MLHQGSLIRPIVTCRAFDWLRRCAAIDGKRTRRNRGSLTGLVVVLLSGVVGLAQSWELLQVQPPAGAIAAIAVNPSLPDRILVGSR